MWPPNQINTGQDPACWHRAVSFSLPPIQTVTEDHRKTPASCDWPGRCSHKPIWLQTSFAAAGFVFLGCGTNPRSQTDVFFFFRLIPRWVGLNAEWRIDGMEHLCGKVGPAKKKKKSKSNVSARKLNCLRKNIFGVLCEVGGKNRKGASKAVEWTNQYGIKRRFTLKKKNKKIEDERMSKFGKKKKTWPGGERWGKAHWRKSWKKH